MKKINLALTLCFSAAILWSCSDNNTSGSTETTVDTTHVMTDTTHAMAPAPAAPAQPLSKEDSAFVMKAAIGGMMEVQAGQMAQEKAVNQRVKDFGAMMVRDHSKANDELKSFASGRGLMIPDSLPKKEKDHLNAMSKMSGKAFDQHYVSMMVDDHKKDVDEFKKQSTGAKDDQLKTWVSNTLPVLQTHLDSIQAIRKMKM